MENKENKVYSFELANIEGILWYPWTYYSESIVNE